MMPFENNSFNPQDLTYLQSLLAGQGGMTPTTGMSAGMNNGQLSRLQQGKNGAQMGAGIGSMAKGIGGGASSGATAGAAGGASGMGISPYTMGANFLASSGLFGKPASSALSRGATGAQIGSLGGPIGTGVGAGLGGLMGLMEGKSGQRGPANVPIQQIPMGGY